MKKILVLFLSLCMLFSLAACSRLGTPVELPSQEPIEAEYLTQVLTLNVFGMDVEVTFVQNVAGTEYMFAYFFAGNDIEGSGEIVDGVYTLTNDPSGFASEMEAVLYDALTSTWTANNGETVTQEPFAAPVKEEEPPVQGDDEPVVEDPVVVPGGEYDKYQIVTIDMFGDKIDVTVSADAAETVFGIAYSAMGNNITASGTIADGVYTLTDDPSGYVSMLIENITALITDNWTEIGNQPAPSGEYDKYQIVTIELFGDKLDITVSADADETVFGIAYTAMGNDVTASGTITDGVYTLTDDPSGYVTMMIENIVPHITDEWTAY